MEPYFPGHGWYPLVAAEPRKPAGRPRPNARWRRQQKASRKRNR